LRHLGSAAKVGNTDENVIDHYGSEHFLTEIQGVPKLHGAQPAFNKLIPEERAGQSSFGVQIISHRITSDVTAARSFAAIAGWQ
jgi:hypothetical protein